MYLWWGITDLNRYEILLSADFKSAVSSYSTNPPHLYPYWTRTNISSIQEVKGLTPYTLVSYLAQAQYPNSLLRNAACRYAVYYLKGSILPLN